VVVSSAAPPSLAEWLRAAWTDPAAGCPPPEAWLAEEQEALTPRQREALRAHLAGCPACQAERELAAAFDGTAAADAEDVDWVVSRLRGAPLAPAAVEPAPGSGSRYPAAAPVVPFARRRLASGSWVVRLVAAAAVVLGIGLAVQTIRLPSPPAPPPGGAARGGAVDLLSPLGEVADPPHELRWGAVPEAAGYRVRIETVTQSPLWDGEAAAGAGGSVSVALPPAVRERLDRAVTYRWTVEAVREDGSFLGRSEAGSFRASPAPETRPAASTPENGEPRS
jgi:hypothetical protein